MCFWNEGGESRYSIVLLSVEPGVIGIKSFNKLKNMFKKTVSLLLVIIIAGKGKVLSKKGKKYS